MAGLTMGSFFNVAGLRVPIGTSVVSPRSHCPSCHTPLTFVDLIPFFSYFFLKGKCRTCRNSISLFYPLIELSTGFLFLSSWLVFGFTWELALSLVFLSMCMIITVSDLAYMIIPDKVLLTAGGVLLFFRMSVAPLDPWWGPFAGAFTGFVLLYVIALVSNGGIGGGDIKLFAVLGLMFGWKEVLLVFFLSICIGSMIGGLGMITGRVAKGKPLPFGPFIVLGALICLFSGEKVIKWYTGLYL
ncbi:prepilin peptidase [Thalassorhabdus alkalitolerans]|uniref:Prepilin leader peptidase/N-methyltransferase n=1 Tax=Thalassorhabdus alkalitolerans TaxID=2282697 RepID=A0ABW0YRD9_9BACI